MVGVPMLKHEKTLCSNPKLFVLKPVNQRLSNTMGGSSFASAALLAPFLNALFAIGEESGWRGFLYPALSGWFPRVFDSLLIAQKSRAAFHS